MKVISVGEVLWDVVGQEEHLGGAPFNFAAHLKRLEHEVFFVSATGQDERGDRITERLKGLGLTTRHIARIRDYPTGIATVDLGGDGQPHFTIHHPAAYDFAKLADTELGELQSEQPDWIYYGTLFQMSPQGRSLIRALTEMNAGAGRFYDVNLRKNCYEPVLVRDLMSAANVVKLSEEEVPEVGAMLGLAHDLLEDFCRSLARRYSFKAVCVTRGAAGCALEAGGEYAEVPGYSVPVVDAIGAGDAFAAAFLHGLAKGWSAAAIGDFANRVAALVVSCPGAIPAWTIEEVQSLVRRV
ncbi:MAG TPA: PfkB family carbohydrate kinase [Terriglobia bacterium]|nr:PfkB family carbohydrate kinase [Terriglobia bacterium]